MTADEALAHSLKIKFGLAPPEPTGIQLLGIKTEIARIEAAGTAATDADWRRTVKLHCPSAGTCVYSGIDNSDLNTLLALAVQSARDGR